VYGKRGSLGARDVLGERGLPIFGVFDLHAGFSPLMAQYSDCLVAYRENPHADASAMAVHAVELLDRTLRTRQCPRTYYRHSKVMWPPTGTCTADSPMRDLEALARQLEREHPEVWAINVIGGFSFADTESTGVSFTVVTTGEEATAQAILDQLCALAWQLREAGNIVDPPLEEVMARLREPLEGLTVIAEPSDNIGGGAPGDGTGLLRAFVEHRLNNAAICICDETAVEALQSMDIGQRITLPIGGKGSRFDPGPLTLVVELVSRSSGKFRLEDPHSHLASMFGGEFDMGPCAVVKHGGLTILLTSRKTPPFDLGQWRSQGIEPSRLSVIAAKAAVAHRNAYAPIAARLWSADTPGPCRSDLRQLPYRYVPQDVYPFIV
jgi:microcystin degradation protein MlrC